MSDDAAAKRRARQTVVNLLLSLLATSGLVLVLVLVTPRDDSNRIKPVDFVPIAQSAETASGLNLVTPKLPTGWWVNLAKWNGAPTDGVKTWKLGLVGPSNQYIGIQQAFGVNPTFVALQTAGYAPDANSATDAPNWSKWLVGKDTKGDPNLWTLQVDGDLVILTATATPKEMAVIAEQIETELKR